jgi:hypothetical protein
MPESERLPELFERGSEEASTKSLELVAELDGRVVGWLFGDYG